MRKMKAYYIVRYTRLGLVVMALYSYRHRASSDRRSCQISSISDDNLGHVCPGDIFRMAVMKIILSYTLNLSLGSCMNI